MTGMYDLCAVCSNKGAVVHSTKGFFTYKGLAVVFL